MSKKSLLLASCLLVGLASCMEEVEVREKPVTEVTDLKVPADFTWSMSRDVLFSIDSPVETVVEIFSTKNCEEGSLLAKVSVPAVDLPLSVANSVDELYVRYTKKDGTKAVMSTATATTRNAESKKTMLPEDTGIIEDDRGDTYMAYPADGYGTLLFEDSWPVKGDYDLNDLVAHYKIQLILDRDKESRNHKVIAFVVGVKLTALGGTLPYQLCLQVDQAKMNNIEEIINHNPSSLGKYKVISDKNESLLIAYDWGNLKGSNGGPYYNTENNHLATGALDGNLVSFYVMLEKEVPLKTWSHASFDFYLKRTDNPTEIHLKGYKPTSDFQSGYNEQNPNKGGIDYSTSDNFVWGVKVPTNITHAKERVSILKAYPEFEKWVISNGTEKKDWYNHRVASQCVPLQ